MNIQKSLSLLLISIRCPIIFHYWLIELQKKKWHSGAWACTFLVLNQLIIFFNAVWGLFVRFPPLFRRSVIICEVDNFRITLTCYISYMLTCNRGPNMWPKFFFFFEIKYGSISWPWESFDSFRKPNSVLESWFWWSDKFDNLNLFSIIFSIFKMILLVFS